MAGQSLVEQYRPTSKDEIQGNNKALDQIWRWGREWSPGDSPVLLVGEPGVGKTTTATVLADEMGWALNEINASSARRSDDIRQIARQAQSEPVGADRALVLLDEVDGLSSQVDLSPMHDLLRDAPAPIVMTCNDEYEVPDAIRRSADSYEFKLGKRSRKARLREIAEAEGIDISKSDLNRLAERPDLRSAVNDLQQLAVGGSIGTDDRTWSEGEFSAIEALLSGDKQRWRDAIGPDDDTFDSPGDAVLWLDENLSNEFEGLAQGLAYQALAAADEWAGRAWHRQEFRFYRHSSAILEEVPELRLGEPYDGWINVDFPRWFRASESTVDDGSPEAKLFEQLSADRGFNFAGSFYEFRQQMLPVLRQLPRDDRMQLALDHGLIDAAVEALDLSPDALDEWSTEDIDDDESPDLTDDAASVSW